MSVSNYSFEVAGAPAGQADGWTVTIVATGGAVAVFAGAPGAPATSVESFEHGFGNDGYATQILAGVRAPFEPDVLPHPTFDSFDGWVAPYFSSVIGGTSAAFSGASTVESFEVGWGGDAYVTSVGAGVTFTDDLETGWLPSPYLTTITGGIAATFSTPSGLVTVESFEDAQPDRPVTVNLAGNLLVSPAHAFDPDQRVTVETTGRRPSPLGEDTFYFVIVVDADHVQLANTAGGAAVVFSDVGAGKHRLRVDPSIYWPDLAA